MEANFGEVISKSNIKSKPWQKHSVPSDEIVAALCYDNTEHTTVELFEMNANAPLRAKNCTEMVAGGELHDRS